MNELARFAFFTVFGFLCGSVMFAYVLPKLTRHVDVIALSEDKNPGTANAVKFAGFPLGMICLLCDMGKGYLPVFLASRALDSGNLMFAAVIAAPVLGHMFSPWLRFRGGKSIAASFGVLIALMPRSPLVWILVFYYLLFTLAVVIRPNSLRTIATFTLFSLTAFALLGYNSYTLGTAIICLAVVWKHAVRLGKINARVKLFAPSFSDKESPDGAKENK